MPPIGSASDSPLASSSAVLIGSPINYANRLIGSPITFPHTRVLFLCPMFQSGLPLPQMCDSIAPPQSGGALSPEPWPLRWSLGTRQVARLVAVMEERKVFGTSGSKTLKELLAEAETPSKKLSARSGAAPVSNGAHHAGESRPQPRSQSPDRSPNHRVPITELQTQQNYMIPNHSNITES